MKRIKLILILGVMCLALSCSDRNCCRKVETGKVLPAWREGELDIHFINTGRGECTWQILPDGTTFLVDASGSLLKPGEKESDPLPGKPSDDISAGKVIVDYINHFSPKVSRGHINYFLLTHYDMDHMGAYSDELPMHESGRFRLGSLQEIGTSLVIDHFFDRSYPDYTYPVPARHDNAKSANYRAFVNWTAEANATVVEAWKPGGKNQIRMLHKADERFSVRNYTANGCYWTGVGEESDTKMPTTEEFLTVYKGSVPKENAFSNSYILSFGDFDFFLGGDSQYNDRDKFEYMDIEAPIAKVAHPVELMKANHHGTANTNSSALLSTLRPDVVVFTPWRDVQPREESLVRFCTANPYISMFCTQMPELNRETLGPEWLARFTAMDGHVVVRVASDTKSYMIYLLDDNDQEYRVIGSYGPYECKDRYVNRLVGGRSGRELFDADTLNILASYRPYKEPAGQLTEAPAGYKPIYLSSYARHGQRKLHRDEYTDYPLGIMESAAAEGHLTPLGQSILEKVRRIDEDMEGSRGTLTSLGEVQHRGIAHRMYDHFPELFSVQGLELRCSCTDFERTRRSMAAERDELLSLNSSIVADSQVVEYPSCLVGEYLDPCSETPHAPLENFLSDHFDAAPVLERLFGTEVPELDPVLFIRNLYVTGACAPGLELENVSFLSSLFTSDELFVCQQAISSMLYTRTGSSALNGHRTLPAMVPLMEDFISRADNALVSGKPSADLRFGHDSYLVPIIALFGLDGYNAVEPDQQKQINIFQDFLVSPMAGNVQMILFSDSSGDALVKFLLNETEASLPLGTDVFPYYHWNDVKKYCEGLKQKYEGVDYTI